MIEIVYIEDLDKKALLFFKAILNLKVFDELRVKTVFYHLGLAHFKPLTTKEQIISMRNYFLYW
jgi:hypothetical protein